MDIILVIYALLVFLIGPVWIIKSVKTDSQNRVKMVLIIIIYAFGCKCDLCINERTKIELNIKKVGMIMEKQE